MSVGGAPTPAHAVGLDYDFSFINAANGGGTVTGYVVCSNNTTCGTAEVVITGNTDPTQFGLGTYENATGQFDTVTITNGSITSAMVEVFLGGNDNSSLFFYYNTVCCGNGFGLTPYSEAFPLGSVDATNLFNADPTFGTTPLPAALPLFATGLSAFGLLGWRRKRKGAAALDA
jgi:hypothetical protein